MKISRLLHKLYSTYSFQRSFFLLGIFIISFSSAAAALPTPVDKITEEKYHQPLEYFLSHLFRQDYNAANDILQKSVPNTLPTYWYFKGLLECTKFNDLGDTIALRKAEESWTKLTQLKRSGPKGSRKRIQSHIYQGLGYLQLSYVNSVKKELMESFLLAKKGIGILEEYPEYTEAMCSLQIYDYYKQELVKYVRWLPFVEVDKITPQKFLLEHYQNSPYLYAFFLTPLVWMQFDLGRYEKGLELTQNFLDKHPENQIFKLMKADLFYKMKILDSAVVLFEDAKGYYSKKIQEGCNYCIPINYWSAVGNLVRVYHDSGQKELMETNRKIWFSEEVQMQEKWLPKSLLKDLERFKL